MRLDLLPTASAPSDEHHLAQFARARAEFCGLGLDSIVTDLGAAVCAADLLPVFDANALFDARLPAGSSVLGAWQSTEANFAERGSRCLEVRPSVVAPAGEVDALVAFLRDRQWYEHRRSVYLLRSAVVSDHRGGTVISARASDDLYAEFARVAAGSNPKLAEYALRKLDDPRYEILVVLSGGRVVARAGVLSLGEIGLLEQVHVLADQRGKGLGKVILQAAIDLCARAQFRHVLLGCDNPRAAALYASIGFIRIGESVEWRSPETLA